MATLTNNNNLSLSMAVWLAHDEYEAGENPYPYLEMISVTTLLKPTRQFVLSQRLPLEEKTTDLVDLVSARVGTAVHKAKEEAWKVNYQKAMKLLGYPQKIIDKVIINPLFPSEDDFPVWLEQRAYRVIDDVVVSGQLDEVINYEINDTKTTSVYGYINSSNDEGYINQLSSYRWLNPELITSDIGRIQHLFTDWQRSASNMNSKYPPHKVIEKVIPLKSLRETEQWISSRIKAIRDNIDRDQESMVRCTREELWIDEPKYKYYADPAKMKRSTKNCDSMSEAIKAKAANGNKGVIVTVEGEPRRCAYCEARPICLQYMEMTNNDRP